MSRPKKSEVSVPEKILKTFLTIAERGGVHEVTLQKISKELKISYSTVHYYYGRPKEKLHLAAMEFVARSAQAYVVEKLAQRSLDPAHDSIASYVTANFEWANQHRESGSYWLYCLYLGSIDPGYRERIALILAEGQRRIADLVRLEVLKQRYRVPETEIPRVAQAIQAAITGGLILASNAAKGKRRFAAEPDATLLMVVSILHAAGTRR